MSCLYKLLFQAISALRKNPSSNDVVVVSLGSKAHEFLMVSKQNLLDYKENPQKVTVVEIIFFC